MNRHRLRGTWEDDPAPIPFPGQDGAAPAGRQAGGQDDPVHPETQPADADTDGLIESVDRELDAASYRLDELRRLVTPFEDDDPPSAA
ncbi:MAG: hypothetical protein AAGB48_01360 [Planctomycetota bacterium]